MNCKSQQSIAIADTSPPVVSVAADASVPIKKATPTEVADRWNKAHDKHDVRALRDLYARHVEFYGQVLTNEECVARKKAAFEKSPDYAQSIKELTTRSVDAGAASMTVVRFTKTSTIGGKSTDYKGVLFIDGAGLVTYESDDLTNANLDKLTAAASTWCTDQSEPSADSVPTSTIMAPYKISSLEAKTRASRSKHFQDLLATAPNDFIYIDIIGCPTKCDRAKRECGYELRVANHSNIGNDSILLDWLYVDAVDGTMWWNDTTGPRSEALP